MGKEQLATWFSCQRLKYLGNTLNNLMLKRVPYRKHCRYISKKPVKHFKIMLLAKVLLGVNYLLYLFRL